MVDVWAYTNCDEVELFINGVSIGRKTKGEDDLNLVWSVQYEAGTLTAVGYTGGKETMKSEVRTAGEPAAIRPLT